VPSRVARIPEVKAARDKALTNLFENDPSVRKLSVKELVERFNNNPNNADTPATADIVKRFRTALNKKEGRRLSNKGNRAGQQPAKQPQGSDQKETKEIINFLVIIK
jgi:hypothetical protein